MIRKAVAFISILFFSGHLFAQDTLNTRGKIKVAKKKESKNIYIKVVASYNDYDLSKLKGAEVVNNQLFQPFPVVHGYAYPFNYSAYIHDCFRFKEINLREKETDTVVLDIKILANGKAYIKDRSKLMMVGGVPAVYDDKEAAYELNPLHYHSLMAVKDIQKWFPGYVILPKKTKYKGETVIKPNKKNVNVSGTITIIFSKKPLED